VGKKHVHVLCIQRTECHIPIQPPVLLAAEKANKPLSYFTAGKTATVFASFSYCFPQPHSRAHPRRIVPIKAMTGVLAALLLMLSYIQESRVRGVVLFSTAGLVICRGSFNTCFSKAKAV